MPEKAGIQKTLILLRRVSLDTGLRRCDEALFNF